MKYCIFSLIFNDYEPVREPLEVDSDADYFLFTDNKELVSETWKIIYIPEFDTDNLTGIQKTYITKYQFYKYLPNYMNYDYFMQIDHSIIIEKSLRPIVEYIDKYQYDLSIAPHPYRQNFMEEYVAWVNSRGNHVNYLIKFFDTIKDFDYQNITGLCECSIKIYKNTKDILNFLDDVYSIMEYAVNIADKNDQCYFTYVLYKYLDKLRINYHPATLYRYSDYMKVCWHGKNVCVGNEPMPYTKHMKFLDRYITVNDIEDYIK